MIYIFAVYLWNCMSVKLILGTKITINVIYNKSITYTVKTLFTEIPCITIFSRQL